MLNSASTRRRASHVLPQCSIRSVAQQRVAMPRGSSAATSAPVRRARPVPHCRRPRWRPPAARRHRLEDGVEMPSARRQREHVERAHHRGHVGTLAGQPDGVFQPAAAGDLGLERGAQRPVAHDAAGAACPTRRVRASAKARTRASGSDRLLPPDRADDDRAGVANLPADRRGCAPAPTGRVETPRVHAVADARDPRGKCPRASTR